MTATLDTRSLNMLVARLIEEENRRAVHLVTGTAIDFCDYRHRVGFLDGLRFAQEACKGVESDLYSGGTKKA